MNENNESTDNISTESVDLESAQNSVSPTPSTSNLDDYTPPAQSTDTKD